MLRPRSRQGSLVLMVGLPWFAACRGNTTPDEEEPPSFCEGPVSSQYDPLSSLELEAWPDAFYTTSDGDSRTGLRVALDPASTPWISSLPPIFQDLFTALDGVQGFARQGAAFLRFDAPIGDALAGFHAEPTLDDPLVWLDLSTSPPTPVPFEAFLDDDGKQLRMQPLRVLSSGARHAILLTDAFSPEAGGCVSPSRVQQELLTGAVADPSLQTVADGYAAALEALGWPADRVSHAITFTTHDDAPALRALADDLVGAVPTWAEAPTCGAPDKGRLTCRGVARVLDARDADGAVREGANARTYDVPVRIWMPEDRGASTPVTMYGHGLNGGAGDGGGRVVDRIVGDLGHVMFASDALSHGEHPTSDGGDLAALPFLGIDLAGPKIDAPGLRGNFVQTALDRIQILDLIQRTPDLDGDGDADLDPDRVAYWGVSLGGLLGPGVLALSDEVDAAVLSVGGGHLIEFALGSDQVAFIQPLLRDLSGGDANLARLLVVAQTGVDGADPAVFAAHTVSQRLGADPSAAPHVLLPVSIFDQVVPPVTGRALARAFPLPHVGEAFTPVPPLPTDTRLPTKADVDGLTLGYFQYDRVTDGEQVVASNHDNTPFRQESYAQLLAFLGGWTDTGVPEIIDPYDELETPPLPSDAKP